MRRHCENPFVAIAVTFLACATSAIPLAGAAAPGDHAVHRDPAFRAGSRSEQGRTRLLWALPLFFILWTNLHGGFFVGLIILGGYTAGEAGARAVHVGVPRSAARRCESAKRYAGTALRLRDSPPS